MNEPSESTKHSLSPIETEGDLRDIEGLNLNKGNGLRLTGFAAGAAALIAVIVAVLGNLDNRQAYVDAGARVAALHESGFEGFWNCTLVGMNQAQLKSAEDLEFQIDKRASHFGHAYAAQITRCSPNLDELERDLSTVTVPESLRPKVAAMAKAAGAQRHALQDLVALFEEHKQETYSSDTMRPAIAKLALAWQQYREGRDAFTEALRGHTN